jgi:hypothetical protein
MGSKVDEAVVVSDRLRVEAVAPKRRLQAPKMHSGSAGAEPDSVAR